MPTHPPTRAIDHLLRSLLPNDGAGDGELLCRFIERRDEAALAALVRRHGPMVWRTCRRLLNHHDAEDAFQAAFLVLVRKAASVVPREMVGNFLYGVAHRTALQARRTAARRRAREVQMTAIPDAAAPPDPAPDEHLVLDEELSRLPDIYRSVIVLCELEGRTRKEVARQLGCPEGTVAGRLARARTMLAKRLVRRGVTSSGGALAAVLAQNAASAGVPTSLVSNTISAATAGVVSAEVTALAEGVLKAMFLSKLKAAIDIVLVLGFLTTGATVLTYRIAAAEGETPTPAEQRVKAKPEPEKEPVTAWGKEVDGLQAGLRFVPADARIYHAGGTLKCEVRMRNVTKADLAITCGVLRDCAPDIKDVRGAAIPATMPLVLLGDVLPIETVLKPGETVTLYHPQIAVRVETGEVEKKLYSDPTIRVPPGKYEIAYRGFVQSHPKLATGTAAFEVEPPLQPEARPTQTEMRVLAMAKSFCVAMRNHHGDKNANALREYIDPAYLKKHDLTDRDLSIPMAAVGALWNIDVADDGRTILCILQTGANARERINEILLLRVSDTEGKGGERYLLPPNAPDPKTGAVTPWILRTKNHALAETEKK